MKYIVREMEVKYKSYKKVKSFKLHEPKDVYRLFKNLENEGIEKFITIYLNSQREIISFSADFSGGINSCSPNLSRILKQSLLQEADAIIVVHNHPSGDCEPSPDDKTFTKELKNGCSVIGIKLLDHIIIGLDNYVSLQDEGML